jgi:anti-anti-sigma factor
MAWITDDKRGPLTIRTEKADDMLTLQAIGDLDIATSYAFEESVRNALGGDASLIVIDLTEVAFIDATGIRAVLWAQDQARAGKRRIRIARPAAIRRVLPG